MTREIILRFSCPIECEERESRVCMKRKHFNLILVIAFIIMIIPFVIISIYSRPSADDFVYSSDTYHLIQSGNWNILDLAKQAFETDVYYYNNWQGLYTSAFVLALQPGIFGEKLYFLGSIFLFILMYFCLYFGLKNINYVLKLRFNLWFSALFLLSFFAIGMPDMLQGIYWFNGAWNYIPFFFLTFLNVSILFRYIFAEGNNGWLIVGSSVLSFLISGGNHWLNHPMSDDFET